MMPANWLPEWLHDPLIQACNNVRVWLVGGAIRNTLLGLETIDFDFAVDGNARSLARSVADTFNGYYYELDRTRDTGRVILIQDNEKRLLLDFSRLRGDQIQDDLKDRDFTINALAVEIPQPEKVIDVTGGLQDLKDKILRLCSPEAILADPIRALRAVRLAVQFELSIDPITLNAIRGNANQLLKVSSERIRDEFFRMMDLPLPGRAIRLMEHLDLNSVLFHELVPLRDLAQPPPHELTGLDHTLAVIDHLGTLLVALSRDYDLETASELIMGEIVYRLGRFRDELNQHLDRELSLGRKIRQLLFFGALYHDAGKPACYTLENEQIHFYGHEAIGAEILAEKARDLKMSNSEVRWLQSLVRNHLRPAQMEREKTISHRAILRFLRATDEGGVEVVLLSLADLLGQRIPPMDQEILSKRVDTARQLLKAIFEDTREYNPVPLLDGNEIAQELDIKPGPEIGRLLETLQEAQVSGEVTSRVEAFVFIHSMHQSQLKIDDAENS
jgi:poly(A) polymerase